ncbi:MAG: Xaa-Pro dipeptidase [Planctomycetes bacterium]|nr:Xaa-Pro dipeptidase [Planctomycetota bacterium]
MLAHAREFAAHLDAVRAATEDALTRSDAAGQSFRGVVFHAGCTKDYHADDQEVPFRSVPHFKRWAPIPGPGHVLVYPRGGEPTLWVYRPVSFWEQPHPLPAHPCLSLLTVREVGEPDVLVRELGSLAGYAYVGNDEEFAEALEVAEEGFEPQPLMSTLDWHRASKTPYEVGCLRAAGELAGRGHAAVRAGVAEGLSERALHLRYLDAIGALAHETPYPNIVCWDEASAVLHYTAKRREAPQPGRSFLIDAGAEVLGYASDITRSYVLPGAPAGFRELAERMYALQEELVQAVAPGMAFVDLHDRSYRGIGQILCDLGVLRVSPEEAYARDLTFAFYPHGLGHHLGLQVHDVGGLQTRPEEEQGERPARFPHLRTVRPVEAGQVITVEPGLYFIEPLLAQYRATQDPAFDWGRLDELAPCGGVRVEDDVHVTADGRDNLTRPFVVAAATPA